MTSRRMYGLIKSGAVLFKYEIGNGGNEEYSLYTYRVKSPQSINGSALTREYYEKIPK